MEGVRQNRHGHRDALMVLLAFRHGLRAAEVVDLRWEQVDFKTATLHIRKAKNGTPATHPLSGREMRELRRHQREGAPHVPRQTRTAIARTGLAAPTAPQGASGAWPIDSPDRGIRLSDPGGIDIQDFINETELFCLIRTKDGGIWCGTIKRSETFGGIVGAFGDDFPGDFYIIPQALRRF